MADSYPVRRVPQPSRRRQPARVVVVAPHPDDDVLGCGGTLARLAQAGAKIAVVYVTDGSASHLKSQRFPPARLRVLREAEARAGLRLLGVRDAPMFLRAPDGGLDRLEPLPWARLVRALTAFIARRRPHIIFTPWSRDPHPDHVATARLAGEVLAAGLRRPRVYRYGVWLHVRGTVADAPNAAHTRTCTVRLSHAELDLKRAAIMAHRSQTSDLIDDDPAGFRIDSPLLARWLTPLEQFYITLEHGQDTIER